MLRDAVQDRVNRNAYPLTGYDKEEVREVLSRINSLDRDEWARSWIQQGDQPLPRKLVIVDTTDPARPTFTTRLTWQVNPTFTDADFAFVPDANAKRIELATYKGTEK